MNQLATLTIVRFADARELHRPEYSHIFMTDASAADEAHFAIIHD